jgi:hypothetical protein
MLLHLLHDVHRHPMRTWLTKSLRLLVLLACATAVHAQTHTPIYRCVGAHGEPKFSSQPCGTEVTLPAGATTVQATDADHVCAASPQALRQAIAGAFESHDVNRLAGLILWRGIDQTSARTMLRSLAEWLKQPLAGIAIAYPTGPPVAGTGPPPVVPAGAGSGPDAPALQASGFEISTGDGDGHVRDFGIIESDGCWWLTFD